MALRLDLVAIGWQNGLPDAERIGKRRTGDVEDVITAAIDRIEYYQQSRFSCQENAAALDHLRRMRCRFSFARRNEKTERLKGHGKPMTRRKLFGVLPIPLLFGFAGPAPEEPDSTIGIETDERRFPVPQGRCRRSFSLLGSAKRYSAVRAAALYQAGKLKQMVRVGRTAN